MEEKSGEGKALRVGDPRVHLANERTFLSWIRTSIGIMAFGFVVEKFALFMKQLEFLVGKPAGHTGGPPATPYSSIFGIVLVAVGALMGVLAFIRYKKVEREIEDDTYKPSMILDISVTLGILAIGVFVIIYMIHSL
jgi:uncharacterized membrane protein YidH (DUF202 family)